MALDNWTITDADPVWDFKVEVINDPYNMRPDEHDDAYDPVKMQEIGDADPSISAEEIAKAVSWAQRAIRAWENDEWQFAIIVVTPVHKAMGAEFSDSADSLGGVDYGWLPGATSGDKGTWTNDREYMREAWINDMIEVARDNAESALQQVKGS